MNKIIINTKEKSKFSEMEKRILISAVKKRELIWDKSQKLHSNRNAIKASWREIADEIGKPDEDCRQSWKSILDSKRYYELKRKVVKKSGSGCELKFLSDDSEDLWEFSEDLEFLTETSELRTTSCSKLLFSPDCQPSQYFSFEDSNLLPTTSADSRKPAYSYKNTNVSPKNLYLNDMRAGVTKVADVMTTLVDIAKKKETSINTSFLSYVDTLLLKLPTEVAQDMQSKIISMLHEEISIQRNIEFVLYLFAELVL